MGYFDFDADEPILCSSVVHVSGLPAMLHPLASPRQKNGGRARQSADGGDGACPPKRQRRRGQAGYNPPSADRSAIKMAEKSAKETADESATNMADK